MITLAQWENTRRVDHVHLPGGLNPRFRGNAGPGLQNLKGLDQFVQAYAQVQGQDDWAKVGALAQIVGEALAHITAAQGQVNQRYITAAQTLLTSANTDLNLLCGAQFQTNRTADLVALHANGPLVQRTVRLNVYYLAPIGANPNVAPIDQTINQHVTNANQLGCYQRASITFQRVNAAAAVATQTASGGSILLPAVASVPLNQQGKFADGGMGGQRLVEYMNASGAAANTIDVVYLDNYENAQNDVQGRAYRTNDLALALNRPIVTVTLNPPVGGAATYPTTLAHELGHAITGCPAHIQDGNNLMSGGNIRNGTNNLSDGQIAWLRNSAWAH
jgi:hypothetical protein